MQGHVARARGRQVQCKYNVCAQNSNDIADVFYPEWEEAGIINIEKRKLRCHFRELHLCL